MAKKQPTTETAEIEISEERQSLSSLMSKKPTFQRFSVWLIGDTPLITHAWSEKARREMLSKQVKAVKSGKEAKDPEQDFRASLYEMEPGVYGFPVTGIKQCWANAAHKDKGVARSAVMQSLYLDAEMVRTRPAMAGAVCDMPLVRIHGTAPEMREDMVKIGAGLNKVANLAYRGQFTIWAIRVTGKFNPVTLTAEQLSFLISEAGTAFGLGEWRNEKKGIFGAFHLASQAEEAAWDKWIAGSKKSAPPMPDSYKPQLKAAE